jgi:hypothetical protein
MAPAAAITATNAAKNGKREERLARNSDLCDMATPETLFAIKRLEALGAVVWSRKMAELTANANRIMLTFLAKSQGA